MLAADTDLQIRASRAAALGAHLHELADAFLVEYLEWVVLQQLALDIRRQEAPGIVAAQAKRRLRQVVGAEREELGLSGDLVGGEGGARELDHDADQVL